MKNKICFLFFSSSPGIQLQFVTLKVMYWWPAGGLQIEIYQRKVFTNNDLVHEHIRYCLSRFTDL